MLLLVLVFVFEFNQIMGRPQKDIGINKNDILPLGNGGTLLLPRILQAGETINITVTIHHTTERININLLTASEKAICSLNADIPANKISIEGMDESLGIENFITHNASDYKSISVRFKRRNSAISSDANLLDVESNISGFLEPIQSPYLNNMRYIQFTGKDAYISNLEFKFVPDK